MSATSDPRVDWAPLVDMTHVRLAAAIRNDGNTALRRSVQRLVKQLDDPDGVISAFSSFVE